jgi:hypothetical protein
MNINNACQQYFKINIPLHSNGEVMIIVWKITIDNHDKNDYEGDKDKDDDTEDTFINEGMYVIYQTQPYIF